MASNHVAFVTAGGLTNATVAHSLYGYCTTAAGTVAKTVTMYKTGSTAGASWATGDLVHGLTITVRFQYSNTAANPTLNVNSTGAKPIYKYGTTVPGTTADTSWPAQAVIQLTYDTLLNTSGCWVMNDHIDNTNTTYSSLTAASGGTDVSLVTTGEKYTWNSKTNNNGTVTSITLKAGNGISLDTDNTAITSSGTRTISHADTSSQSSSSNSGRTYIQSVTLDDYGHVTGLSTATESVTNTDTKLQVAAVTSGTTYYPIVGTGTSAATRQYDTTGLVYVGTNGTANGTNGNSLLTLGNSTASTTANWKKGTVRLYGTTAYYTDIVSGAPTANRTITLPNKTGTVALTDDIPTVPTNVSSFTNDVGYVTTDTKNTTGSTASTSKLFLVGATSQAANPQTYSRSTAYVGTDGHLYSNSKQVVNLSDTQALTNKTYNGYTLAAACAKGVDTSISSTSSTNLPTTAAVTAYTDDIIVIDENEPTSSLTKIWIKI